MGHPKNSVPRKGVASEMSFLLIGWFTTIAVMGFVHFPSTVQARELEHLAKVPARIDLEVHGTRVSGVIQQAPLQQVLQHLGLLLPLTLDISAQSPNPQISVTFTNMPIDQALDRLLHGQNYALSHLPTTNKPLTPEQPIHVILLPLTPSTASMPSPKSMPSSHSPTDSSSIEEWLKQSSRGETPVIRIAALGQLYRQIPPTEMQPILLDALQDEDPQVRTLSLTMLGNSDQPEVLEAVMEAARWDVSPQIRMEALKILAKQSSPTGKKALNIALEDPEESVRLMAQQLLDQQQPPSPQ